MSVVPETPVEPSPRLAVRVGRRECPSPHSWRNRAGRVLWGIVWGLLFRPSPRICFGWRRFLLRIFGAHVGRNARISPPVRIWAPWNLAVGEEASLAHGVDCYCVDRLTIGDHATVSQYAFLCTASHDPRDPHMRLVTAPVTVGPQSWVCAGAYLLPGVNVGPGAIVGAGAVVTRHVEAWEIVAGNPARRIGRRQLRACNAAGGEEPGADGPEDGGA